MELTDLGVTHAASSRSVRRLRGRILPEAFPNGVTGYWPGDEPAQLPAGRGRLRVVRPRYASVYRHVSRVHARTHPRSCSRKLYWLQGGYQLTISSGTVDLAPPTVTAGSPNGVATATLHRQWPPRFSESWPVGGPVPRTPGEGPPGFDRPVTPGLKHRTRFIDGTTRFIQCMSKLKTGAVIAAIATAAVVAVRTRTG